MHALKLIDPPQLGLLPSVSRRISSHVDLFQRTKDAEILSRASAYALRCRDTLTRLSKLVSEVRLAEANTTSRQLQELIHTAPEPLPRAKVFSEIKVCALLIISRYFFAHSGYRIALVHYSTQPKSNWSTRKRVPLAKKRRKTSSVLLLMRMSHVSTFSVFIRFCYGPLKHDSTQFPSHWRPSHYQRYSTRFRRCLRLVISPRSAKHCSLGSSSPWSWDLLPCPLMAQPLYCGIVNQQET